MRKALRITGTILAVVITLILVLLAVLTLLEYKPEYSESLDVAGNNDKQIKVGDEISIATWNIGYGCLGETTDFFMDGGKGVKTATKDETEANMAAISKWISDGDFDIVALQEIDRSSTRSSRINELESVQNTLSEHNSVFASNFKVAFVPYPLPPIGKVDSGIATFSKYSISEATRYSLPCPFSWPIRTCNLKRALAVTRIPLNYSEKELVIVNLHLEAYDSGEGKIQQTKELIDLLNEERTKGNYVIALGDFNQEFSNIDRSAYPVLPDRWMPGRIDAYEFGDKWTLLMDNSAPTCRSLDQPYDTADKEDFQYYLIDGAVVSNNIKVNSIKTNDLGFVNSDHNPVSMSLTLEE